jgi:transcription elongation factor
MGNHGAAWEDRLSELADYPRNHGTAMFPATAKTPSWLSGSRTKGQVYLRGKTSAMTLSAIQELESLGFRMDLLLAAWEDRLGLPTSQNLKTCNVLSALQWENTKLGRWVDRDPGSLI